MNFLKGGGLLGMLGEKLKKNKGPLGIVGKGMSMSSKAMGGPGGAAMALASALKKKKKRDEYDDEEDDDNVPQHKSFGG